MISLTQRVVKGDQLAPIFGGRLRCDAVPSVLQLS